MPEPMTMILLPSLLVASAAIVNVTMSVSNNMNRITRFFYISLFLRDEYIRIDKTKDPLGHAQVTFMLNTLLKKLGVAGCRQIVHMKSGGVDARIVIPDVGCFVAIKEKNVEIEVEPNSYRIWCKAFHAGAADQFVHWMGTTVFGNMQLPKPDGLRANTNVEMEPLL